MKAEQFRCGPGAIAWILVCERARSVTPRAWDVSRDKVHVSWFNEGREDVSWCSTQDSQSHTHRLHPIEDKTLTSLFQWCATSTRAATFSLAWVL